MSASFRKATVLGAAVLGAVAPARAETATQVNAEIGTVSYTKTDHGDPTQGGGPKKGSAQVMGAEYTHFYRLDRAYFLGYRQATDPATQRNYYLAGYAGYRYYPRHVGFPIDEPVGDATVRFNATLKPYVEGSLALGRALYGLVAPPGELAADILGLNVGGGLTWHPVSRFVLDTGVKFEQYQQNGGSANALSLSGTNLYILIGTGFLF